MAYYRAYLLAHDDSIVGFHGIECVDDRVALFLCRRITGCVSIELWERSRLIGRVEPVAFDITVVEMRCDYGSVAVAAMAAEQQASMMAHERKLAAVRIEQLMLVMAERLTERDRR